MKHIYITAILLLIGCYCYAQDIEALVKEKPVTVSGSLAASANWYNTVGIENRRAPFNWLLTGNLNVSLYGIAIPISATLSQQDQSISYPQPFNQFGCSPKYKSVTLHLGYRSMRFSELTLGGSVFLGAGIEVAPTKYKVKASALYGRFARAIQATDDYSYMGGIPTYERWGLGSKISYGDEQNTIAFSFIKASDDPHSVSDSLASILNIKPAENLVSSLAIKRKFGKRVEIDAEYAASAYTTDIRMPLAVYESYTYINNLRGIYTPRISSQFNTAFIGKLILNGDKSQFNLSYRRIDPEYRTMGSTFLTNDIEDITAGVAWQMFSNKVNIATNGGLQRNNLDKNQLSTTSRVVGNLTVGYTPVSSLNINLAFANFNSSSQLSSFVERSLINNRDSLYFLQVTNNVSLSASYNPSSAGLVNHAFSLNISNQKASDNQGSNSSFYNLSAGHQLSISSIKLSLSTNLNANKVVDNIRENLNVGPALSINKALFNNKVRSSITGSAINTYTGEALVSKMIVLRNTWSYSFAKRHSMGADLSFLRRTSTDNNMLKSFLEIKGGISYSCSF